MDMRVKPKVSCPRVQYRRDAERGLHSRVAQLQQRLGSCAHQCREQLTAAIGNEGMQLARHGEDDVEVSDWQDPLLSSLDPTLLCKCLTLRAMPIPARVVGWAGVAATITDIKMATEAGRAARCHGGESTPLFESAQSLICEPVAVSTSNLSDVELWSMGAPSMERWHG
jgi:hypothetical protein